MLVDFESKTNILIFYLFSDKPRRLGSQTYQSLQTSSKSKPTYTSIQFYGIQKLFISTGTNSVA